MIRIKALNRKNWASYSEAMQQLESIAEYPYGDDYFKINHGTNYFSFFERLGEPLFHVALDGEKIIACAAGVLRNISTHEKKQKAWYLCDLKVHPDYRKQQIPAKLFRKNIFLNYLRCQSAYAISMNPAGKINRVVEIAKRFPFFPISLSGELNIYSLTYDQINESLASITNIAGPISFLSLSDQKDLIMKSTKLPMKVLHCQHGPLAQSAIQQPQKNFIHMICSTKHSALDKYLSSKFSISATASILAHRMNNTSWDFILTSDI